MVGHPGAVAGAAAAGWRWRASRSGSDVCFVSRPYHEELVLLTESEVHRSFRKLFKGAEITSELLDKAEDLLDELRPESPLRHRLDEELEELRGRLASSK
jgi:hypothetical protein